MWLQLESWLMWWKYRLWRWSVLKTVGATVLFAVGMSGVMRNAVHLSRCINSVNTGLSAEALDDKMGQVVYWCNTTEAERTEGAKEWCSQVMPLIAKESQLAHDQFILSAAQCVPVEFTNGKKATPIRRTGS